MSNEVKTKEKVDMDPKYIITLTVTLFVTCVIVAGLLGLVNGVTAGPIAEINWQNTQTAMTQVVSDPDNTTFGETPLENTQAMTDAAAAAGGTLGDIYEAQVNGETGGLRRHRQRLRLPGHHRDDGGRGHRRHRHRRLHRQPL